MKLSVLALAIVVVPMLAANADATEKRQRVSRSTATFDGPVPTAHCGPTDWTETGLAGQTTSAERLSGLSELGFQCNLELVGQYQGQGSKYQITWFGDCAYMEQNGGTQAWNAQRHPGVAVIDVADPRRPRPIQWLDTPAMRDPHEGLEVHSKRKILAGMETAGYGFSVFDLSADCRMPRLASNIVLPRNPNTSPNAGPDGGHAGSITPDGKTYVASHAFRGLQGIASVVDLTDINDAKSIMEWQYPGNGRGHDYSWSPDGMLMYANQPGQYNNPVTGSSYGPNGLVILDFSDVQLRKPNPQIRELSTHFWEDGGQGQQAKLMWYKGVPHIIATDESGSGGTGGREGACARGVNGFTGGFARIIDVSDALNPRTISKLMLESQDARNCAQVLATDTAGPGPNNCSSHYCVPDVWHDPHALACSWRDGGLRVFDIRDPLNPSEIAYYKPPARRTQFLPGSALWTPTADRFIDHTPTVSRWHRYKDEIHLWTASQDNGFMVLVFTNDVLKGIVPDDERFDEHVTDGM